jgi:hypothetical protein
VQNANCELQTSDMFFKSAIRNLQLKVSVWFLLEAGGTDNLKSLDSSDRTIQEALREKI